MYALPDDIDEHIKECESCQASLAIGLEMLQYTGDAAKVEIRMEDDGMHCWTLTLPSGRIVMLGEHPEHLHWDRTHLVAEGMTS
jgi:hypothetical protein